MEYDEDKSIQREIDTKHLLYPRFVPLGSWRFMSISTGKVHDLSAADILQIDRIEQEGLFLV